MPASQKDVVFDQVPFLKINGSIHTKGDTDFDGNGPKIDVWAAVLVANPYQLAVQAQVTFTETKSDWTTWFGSQYAIVWDVRAHYPNATITNVVTPAFSTSEMYDGYDPMDWKYGPGSIVSAMEAVGDLDGGVFGGDDAPWATLYFNPVAITIEETRQEPQPSYMPPAIPSASSRGLDLARLGFLLSQALDDEGRAFTLTADLTAEAGQVALRIDAFDGLTRVGSSPVRGCCYALDAHGRVARSSAKARGKRLAAAAATSS
jgi:hypothetical protein